MKIGLQISSLRPYIQTEDKMRETFQKVAQMGYDTVQLQWLGKKIPVQKVADALKENGLKSVSVQDFYEEVRKDEAYYLELNEACGAKDLCVSGIPEQYMQGKEGVLAYAGELTAWMENLKNQGKMPREATVSFHPRKQEYALFEGKTAVELVMEHTPQDVRLALDLYHVVKGGQDMERWIRTYGKRISCVHFKDYTVTEDGEEYLVPAGQGEIDWEGAVKACEACGVEYGFIEQEKWKKDAFLCMEEGMRAIQKLIFSF